MLIGRIARGGASFFFRGVRLHQAGQARGQSRPDGMGESAFLADHRRDEGRWHGGAVASGRRIAIGVAPPGLEQEFASRRHQDQSHRFPGQGWRFRGSTRDIEFPDGRKMDLGGSGPKDGDKQDK
jgi:hypothetical protein